MKTLLIGIGAFGLGIGVTVGYVYYKIAKILERL